MTGECRPGSSAAPPYARPSRTALTLDPAYPRTLARRRMSRRPASQSASGNAADDHRYHRDSGR